MESKPENSEFLKANKLLSKIKEQIESVIVGKAEAVEISMTAFLARGHVLLEDLPGTGKTTLAKTLARSLGCLFQRVQFTPDLMPSDITGLNYFNPKSGDFEFRKGPVLTNILLADEINRGTPRTQSALLEAMEERQVTVDGVTHPTPQPFFVLATQNPIESEGTFALPFSQQDRFMLKIKLGFPSREDEGEVLNRHSFGDLLSSLEPLLDPGRALALQGLVRHIYMEESLVGYILDLVEATRHHPALELALSPRASLSMVRGSKALALQRGREYVIPDDIKDLCLPVFSHRLKLKRSESYKDEKLEGILMKIMKETTLTIKGREK